MENGLGATVDKLRLDVLCEMAMPAATPIPVVTSTMPGAVWVACRALEPGKRDQLRTDAMTRMLRNGV